MAWIEQTDVADATGLLAKIYADAKKRIPIRDATVRER